MASVCARAYVCVCVCFPYFGGNIFAIVARVFVRKFPFYITESRAEIHLQCP